MVENVVSQIKLIFLELSPCIIGVSLNGGPMFARIKKSGPHQYLQIVENHREGPKTIQRVIVTIGRMDHLQAKGDIETLI